MPSHCTGPEKPSTPSNHPDTEHTPWSSRTPRGCRRPPLWSYQPAVLYNVNCSCRKFPFHLVYMFRCQRLPALTGFQAAYLPHASLHFQVPAEACYFYTRFQNLPSTCLHGSHSRLRTSTAHAHADQCSLSNLWNCTRPKASRELCRPPAVCFIHTHTL